MITAVSDLSMSFDVEGWMAFREVSVIEVREVLRAWLAGGELRKVAEQAGVDRKTIRYAGSGITNRLAVHLQAGRQLVL